MLYCVHIHNWTAVEPSLVLCVVGGGRGEEAACCTVYVYICLQLGPLEGNSCPVLSYCECVCKKCMPCMHAFAHMLFFSC